MEKILSFKIESRVSELGELSQACKADEEK
jgi:hypothetical protein